MEAQNLKGDFLWSGEFEKHLAVVKVPIYAQCFDHTEISTAPKA